MEYANLFPGIGIELLCAVWLMLAAYGSGSLVFLKTSQKPSQLVMLVCGMAVNAALGVFVIPSVMILPLGIVGCFGAYKLFFEIKKAPWLWGCTAVLTLLFAGNALLPPWSWDEQVYQISLLKYYAAQGTFPVRLDNPYSSYPSLVHAFLLPAVAAGGVTVARLTALMTMAVCGAGFYRAFARDKFLTLPVLAALMLSQLTLILVRDFYVEPFILLFAFAGLDALWRRIPGRADVVAAAIAAAACASVKLTGLGMALCIVISLFCRPDSRKYWKTFFAVGALTAMPFFCRVLWYNGNPFYPYFSGLFGSIQDVEVEKFHRVLGGHYGIDPIFGTGLGWLFAAWQKKLYDGIVTGWQFPLFFLTALVGSWRLFRNEPEKGKQWLYGMIILLAGYIFWSLTARQTRFLFPVMFVAAALSLAVIIYSKNRLWRKIFIALTCGTLLWSVYSGYRQILHYYHAWRLVKNVRQHPLEFAMRHERGMVPFVRQINALPQGSRIAMLMERRTLYLKRDVTLLMPFFQKRLTPLPENSAALLEELKHFDYLAVRLPETDVDSAEEYVPQFARLYGMVKELVDSGELQYLQSSGQAILRVAP